MVNRGKEATTISQEVAIGEVEVVVEVYEAVEEEEVGIEEIIADSRGRIVEELEELGEEITLMADKGMVAMMVDKEIMMVIIIVIKTSKIVTMRTTGKTQMIPMTRVL
jgi:hypothetical protein